MSGSKLLDDSSSRPLGLTIYSLPTPEQAVGAPQRQTAAGRWRMLLVLAVCAAPVIASYFTFYVVRPEGRRNFGELIEPQLPLPGLATTGLDGQAGKLTALRGQWLLLSVAEAACQARCQKNLYLQRQLREGLGKDRDRLDWVWLLPDAAPVAPALLPALKDATVLRVAADGLAQWLAPEPGHQISEHLYLVDPMGNWMMRFPANLDEAGAARVKRDLERLLRAAASWDRPGR